MKVYIVLEDENIIGVFGSEEKAKDKIISRAKDDNVSNTLYQDDIDAGYFTGTFEEWVITGSVSDFWRIEEHEVA